MERYYSAGQKIEGEWDFSFLSQLFLLTHTYSFDLCSVAKQLLPPQDCGVFGVSSDEYLNYAEKNRQEWEERGEEVVAELVEKAKTFEKNNFGVKIRRRDSVL